MVFREYEPVRNSESNLLNDIDNASEKMFGNSTLSVIASGLYDILQENFARLQGPLVVALIWRNKESYVVVRQ